MHERATIDRSWLEADRRPGGVSDATVEAVGKLGEAVECIERARGSLYDFHQLSGHADLLLGVVAGREHVHESEMTERRRTHGRRHHEQGPDVGA